jgi:hypothetical protein
MAYLKDHPDTPRLYESGVSYERPAQFQGECPEVVLLRELLGDRVRDPRAKDLLKLIQAVLGGERFRDIGRALKKKLIDCDNLATWRAAELRQAGIPADPYIKWRTRLDGGNTYHVLVRWPFAVDSAPDGFLEDPSLLLGMGGPARKADRDREIWKNAERVKMMSAGKAPAAGAARAAFKDEAASAIEDVLGRHHGGSDGRVYLPVDPEGFLDLDRDFGESWDEAVLRHSGMMRGR